MKKIFMNKITIIAIAITVMLNSAVIAKATKNDISSTPQNIELSNKYLNAGREYVRNIDFHNAEKQFKAAISANPQNAEAFCAYALLKSKLGDTKSAIEYYTKSILLDKANDKFYVQRGMEYCLSDKLELAMKDFNKAIELNNQNSVAYMSRGSLYGFWGNSQKALDDFDKAIEFSNDSNMDITYSTRAEIKISLMDYDGALADYKIAITKAEKNNNQKAIDSYKKRMNLIKEAKKVFR